MLRNDHNSRKSFEHLLGREGISPAKEKPDWRWCTYGVLSRLDDEQDNNGPHNQENRQANTTKRTDREYSADANHNKNPRTLKKRKKKQRKRQRELVLSSQ